MASFDFGKGSHRRVFIRSNHQGRIRIMDHLSWDGRNEGIWYAIYNANG